MVSIRRQRLIKLYGRSPGVDFLSSNENGESNGNWMHNTRSASMQPLPSVDIDQPNEGFWTRRKETSLHKEREDAEFNEKGFGQGEKKQKKQKSTEEEGIVNSLNLRCKKLVSSQQEFVSTKKEIEEELEFCSQIYSHNETYKEIKNKMQILCDEMKSSMIAPVQDIGNDENEDSQVKTICIGPFHVRTTNAPTAEDKRLLEWIFKEQHVEEEEAEVASVVDCCFPVKKNLMYCLRPKTWLSSFIINFVVEMLCVKELKKRNLQRWYFVVDLMGKDGGIRKNRLLYLQDPKKLQSVEQFFFPMSRGNHFFLIVVNTKEKKMEVWDTMKEPGTYCYKKEFKNVCTVLDAYIHPQKSYSKNVVEIPQQKNSYDCGVFVCYYLEFPEDVHKFQKEKWISEEERCQLSLRILKSIDNQKIEHIYQSAERWFKIGNTSHIEHIYGSAESVATPISLETSRIDAGSSSMVLQLRKQKDSIVYKRTERRFIDAVVNQDIENKVLSESKKSEEPEPPIVNEPSSSNKQPVQHPEFKKRKRHRRKNSEKQEACVMRGVYYKNMKWQAAIEVDKKQIHLGTASSQEEAARLYDWAASMCGREPNFELTVEQKDELSRMSMDEFLTMTRSAINDKKNQKRVSSRKKFEHQQQNISASEADQGGNGCLGSDDADASTGAYSYKVIEKLNQKTDPTREEITLIKIWEVCSYLGNELGRRIIEIVARQPAVSVENYIFTDDELEDICEEAAKIVLNSYRDQKQGT